MSEFVLKPKEEEVEAKVPEVQFDALEDELKGAERAEGEERVAQAVLEVQVGIAQPEALLEWMDDLRDPEVQEKEDDNLERSFTMDFIPDTARDNAATETPPGDDYMFFSANRRTPFEDDDDGGGGGGGGGAGDGAGEGEGGDAPADPKDPKDSKKAPDVAKAGAAKADKPAAKKPEPPPSGKGGGKKPDK